MVDLAHRQNTPGDSTADTEASPNKLEDVLANAQSLLEKINEVHEGAKVAARRLEDSQRQIGTAHADAQAKLTEITNTATEVLAAKTKIIDAQAVIATKSDHIQKAQEHADSVRANLDRTLTAATQQATAAEAQQSKTQSSADNAANVLASVQSIKAAAESEATTIATARKTAVESATLTKGLADKSAAIETRIADYEKRLGEFENQCVKQLETIETLLRGATSAGLAHSFDERRKTFLKPHNRWQIVFVSSVVAIVLLTITGLIQVYKADGVPTYDELIRLWLARLPIAGALVWLALHASRESALAKRLEEDYGYKSAIASCFEGFRKQMSEIGKDIPQDSALAKLCGDTLTTIAAPPGRIYDRHKLTVSPVGELKEVAKATVEIANVPKPTPK